MTCPACDSEMDLKKIYGDGYIEPREHFYTCDICGAKLSTQQGCGSELDLDGVAISNKKKEKIYKKFEKGE